MARERTTRFHHLQSFRCYPQGKKLACMSCTCVLHDLNKSQHFAYVDMIHGETETAAAH